MIVPKEELAYYLGKEFSELDRIAQEGKIKTASLEKLMAHDDITQTEYGLSIIDYLFLWHQFQGRSIRSLAKEVGIGYNILFRIFDELNLPTLTRSESRRRELYQR